MSDNSIYGWPIIARYTADLGKLPNHLQDQTDFLILERQHATALKLSYEIIGMSHYPLKDLSHAKRLARENMFLPDGHRVKWIKEIANAQT